MRFETFVRPPRPCAFVGSIATRLTPLLLSLTLVSVGANANAQTDSAARAAAAAADPRVGLAAGWMDAAQTISNLELVAHRARPEGFFDPSNIGDFGTANSDIAFSGDNLFLGNFNGFQVWNISDPGNPALTYAHVCPGGQGDLSVYDNLLFMSVEETRGRVDCGTQGVADTVSAERFRGVRIFDITDVRDPRQIAAVQSCRGSHTHTLVTDPRDSANIYIYIQGTSRVRPAAELAGCSGLSPDEDPNTAYFRIEVVRVPLAAPRDARIINSPRIFADTASGNIAGLWQGGTHGEGTQRTSVTNQCHDITAYPEAGLAAGACSGNGILLDIRDPANPVRIDEVIDPNFAYWHSATFSNDGGTVLFTDEWGGGTAPRCQATDRPEWGANAIFTLADGELDLASYYKLPAPQTSTENCVAHNGSLIPVPGRNIMAQAWYQGGISVFDYTDPMNPVEIAYFDRGPMSATELHLGGYWSAYWYNGHIYGSEIGRGLDVFTLTPSEHLSQNEIDAAMLVQVDEFNPQHQSKLVWPTSFVVARAYVDQIARDGDMPRDGAASIGQELDRAEKLQGAQRRSALAALATRLERSALGSGDTSRVRELAEVVRELAGAGE